MTDLEFLNYQIRLANVRGNQTARTDRFCLVMHGKRNPPAAGEREREDATVTWAGGRVVVAADPAAGLALNTAFSCVTRIASVILPETNGSTRTLSAFWI